MLPFHCEICKLSFACPFAEQQTQASLRGPSSVPAMRSATVRPYMVDDAITLLRAVQCSQKRYVKVS